MEKPFVCKFSMQKESPWNVFHGRGWERKSSESIHLRAHRSFFGESCWRMCWHICLHIFFLSLFGLPCLLHRLGCINSRRRGCWSSGGSLHIWPLSQKLNESQSQNTGCAKEDFIRPHYMEKKDMSRYIKNKKWKTFMAPEKYFRGSRVSSCPEK
ncbi:MAG: hypothetical protein ACD_78C00133G0007 [uncultured bacterium (gcode 4)]|uniref:Uncharacterized protein n=1 Tax=uncultured bacterium (gcode 4) TaxID=1234023 RepID=K1XYH9_9BACT|nr:MAG: hypothetical protein ACD_78C00133G0007 [uncultured bacterium (gcode 4)]